MKSSFITRVRAHAVLVSIVTSIISVACLAILTLIFHVEKSQRLHVCQVVAPVLALAVTFWIRHTARIAYVAAMRTGKVREAPSHTAIDDDCPRAWLVQLHVELHGRQCSRS
jgi:hypothetical protein